MITPRRFVKGQRPEAVPTDVNEDFNEGRM